MQFYIPNPEGISLTHQQLFGISLGLIIAEQNGAYVDSLETGETRFPQAQMMQRNWGISDGEDAISFMEARLTEGHRAIFNPLLEIYASREILNPDLQELARQYPQIEENGYYLENLEEICDLELGKTWLGNKKELFKIGADAWDFGRIIFVARVTYSLGYITEQQAWNYINQVAELAQQKYNNWKDYATGYVLGRAMWGGDDGEWENIVAFAADGLSDAQSPWLKLAW